MAKKRDSGASSACERILNAIRPRRVSRPIGPDSPGKPPKRQSPPPPPSLSGNRGMAVAGNGKEMTKPVKIAPATESERTKPQGDHVENRFSDYLEQAKAKLRTVSSIGRDGKKEKGDSSKKTDEHFTNFIDKAKARLRRNASSIGGGKGGVDSHK